jgi:hypothetical protein
MVQITKVIFVFLIAVLFTSSCDKSKGGCDVIGTIEKCIVSNYSEFYEGPPKSPNISFLMSFYCKKKDTMILHIPNESMVSNNYFTLFYNNDNYGNLLRPNKTGSKKELIISNTDTTLVYLKWRDFNCYRQSISDILNQYEFLSSQDFLIEYKSGKLNGKVCIRFSEDYSVVAKLDSKVIDVHSPLIRSKCEIPKPQ